MKRLIFWDILSSGVFLTGAIIFGYSCHIYGTFDNMLTLVGVIIAVLGVVIDIITQRCPFCKHFLGIFFAGKRKKCPFCGYEIK